MLKYIFLGIIQGFTEFLPVSSSGHLVIAQKLFGLQGEEIALSVVLHLGTTLALIIFFFRDILKLLRDLRLLSYVIVATSITGIVGITGKDFFERLFSQPKSVAIALIFTGLILIFTKKFAQAQRQALNIKDTLAFGFSQAVAIIPGISRSGITISTLLWRKIAWETAFRFSFVASIPAILGATLLETKKIQCTPGADLKNFAAGFIFSFLSGILSLWILKNILQRAKLYYFGYYCLFVAVITLLFLK